MQYAGQDFDVEGLVRRVRNHDSVAPQTPPGLVHIQRPGYPDLIKQVLYLDLVARRLTVGNPIGLSEDVAAAAAHRSVLDDLINRRDR